MFTVICIILDIIEGPLILPEGFEPFLHTDIKRITKKLTYIWKVSYDKSFLWSGKTDNIEFVFISLFSSLECEMSDEGEMRVPCILYLH